MLDFCAIDFETANANRGSACAVGLARVRDGVLVENIGGYIRPPDDLFWFDFANTRVHGLTEQHVLRAPDWRKALAKICEFVAEDQVFAHNAAFDWSVIAGACEAERVPLPSWRIECSLRMARELYPQVPSHRLPAMASLLGVPMGQHHSAVDDAAAAAAIVVAMRTAQQVAQGA